uniref:Transmembrane protein n=1 Tax=Bryopsis sp. HV04063 TaxID=1979421 RepID=A0A2P0QH55_9CHLO|nr:hypothetical protein [Bryopsis sp. HV04063]ARO74111.1 hypothetical protein [Bryopsis sp. HV04063]
MINIFKQISSQWSQILLTFLFFFLLAFSYFTRFLGNVLFNCICLVIVLIRKSKAPQKIRQKRISTEKVEKDEQVVDCGNFKVSANVFVQMRIFKILKTKYGFCSFYLQLLEVDKTLAKHLLNYSEDFFQINKHRNPAHYTYSSELIIFLSKIPNLGKFLDQTFDLLDEMDLNPEIVPKQIKIQDKIYPLIQVMNRF